MKAICANLFFKISSFFLTSFSDSNFCQVKSLYLYLVFSCVDLSNSCLFSKHYASVQKQSPLCLARVEKFKIRKFDGL